MQLSEEDIQVIFDFWNEYKGKGNWKSHLKLSDDMLLAIVNSLKKYNVEEICSAIDNYATILLNDEYWWTHAWSLTTFLTVKAGTYKDAPLKWLRCHPDNFIIDNYKTSKGAPEDVREVEPEFVDDIIRRFGRLIGNKEYVPDRMGRIHFASCANKLRKYTSKYGKKEVVQTFFDFLESEFIDKQKIIYPANLNNKTTVDVMFAQYLKDIGVI